MVPSGAQQVLRVDTQASTAVTFGPLTNLEQKYSEYIRKLLG